MAPRKRAQPFSGLASERLLALGLMGFRPKLLAGEGSRCMCLWVFLELLSACTQAGAGFGAEAFVPSAKAEKLTVLALALREGRAQLMSRIITPA